MKEKRAPFFCKRRDGNHTRPKLTTPLPKSKYTQNNLPAEDQTRIPSPEQKKARRPPESFGRELFRRLDHLACQPFRQVRSPGAPCAQPAARCPEALLKIQDLNKKKRRRRDRQGWREAGRGAPESRPLTTVCY